MTPFVPLSEFMPYGAPELQGCAPRHLSRALVAGSLLVTLAFALAGTALRHHASDPPLEAPPSVFDWLPPPPPPLRAIDLPRTPAPVAPARRSGSIAVPVADDLVSPDRTIAERGEWSPGLPGAEPGTVDAFAPPGASAPATEERPVFGEHQVVDVLPNAWHRVRPDYPELARQAGVEGLVVVHALVGRDGRVIELRLDAAHSIPLLDAAALDAARRWRFSPALTNGRAVPAWVAIRLRFTLNESEW